jgi:23S rRNA pseudouridine1911/1915/1917 synthase
MEPPDHEPLVVPTALEGERIDRAVAMLTGWTRADVQVLVRAGAVRVGGRAVGKSRRLRAGEVVELLRAPAVADLPIAEDVPVQVRHADDDVIVVNKPAGLVVHPGAGHIHGTLVHGLLALFPEIASVGDPARPGIVHRLDRDTSGLLVVARTSTSYEALVTALARHDVDRRYTAVVAGIPSARRGVVDAPIGRAPQRRTRMAVREGGRPSRTAYEVAATWTDPETALLACTLETGRTHQIRVHLSAIGHPVVGDAAYGGRLSSRGVDLGRPFLHAGRLAFPHPSGTGVSAFEEPLPVELAAFLEILGPPDEETPTGPDANGSPVE